VKIEFLEIYQIFPERFEPFKIRGRFKIYFVPEFLTCNSEGIQSWDKK
jgi:hypothetical protein